MSFDWADAKNDTATRAAASCIFAIGAARTSKLEEGLLHCDRSIELYDDLAFRKLSDEEQALHQQFLWSAHNARANVLDELRQPEQAEAAYRHALKLADAYDYPHGILISQFNLCDQLLHRGEVTEATYEALHTRVGRFPELSGAVGPLQHEVMALTYYGSDLPEKALEQCRLAINKDEPEGSLNSLLTWTNLAYLEAGFGDLGKAQAALAHVHQYDAPDQPSYIRSAVITGDARLLARQGEVDMAIDLMTAIDLSDTSVLCCGITDPAVVTTELLVLGHRHDEALAFVEGKDDELDCLAKARIRRLRAEALAGLGRWQEALVEGRRAEEIRRWFDLDSERYAKLCHPDDPELDDELRPSVIADLYARQIRLRDLLAHDIRGLFNAVQLAYQAATVRSEPDRIEAKLGELVSLIDALHDVPTNAAAYLRLVDGTAEVELLPVRVIEVVNAVFDRYRLQAERKGIRLLRDSSPDVRVLADIDMLQACLSNLVSNGLKFSDDGDTVTIAWAASDDAGLGKPAVDLAVSDQGPGLTAEEQHQIFRRSRTFSAAPTGGESSSGLGLHIVVGFIDRMAGRVRAEHNPGGGSRFVLTLHADERVDTATVTPQRKPLASSSPIPADRSLETKGSSNGSDTEKTAHRQSLTNGSDSTTVRALVIDDDPAAAAVLAELIGSTGSEVVTATSFEEACIAARSGPTFDLVVSDIMFGEAPLGLELVRRIHRLMPQALITVATGLGEAFNNVPGEVRYVLRKPIQHARIAELVDEASRMPSRARRPALVGLEDRSQLLTDVTQGRVLREDELVELITNVDSEARVEGLTIASVHEGIQGHWQYSLQLGLRGLDEIAKRGTRVDTKFLWQLNNNLGIDYLELGRVDDARNQHELALALAKTANYEYGIPRSAMNLANAYNRLGKADKAVDVLATATHQIGADQKARAQLFSALGQQLFRQEETNLAIAQYRRSLSNFSPIEVKAIRMVLRWLVRAYLEEADYDSARVALNRLERIDDQKTHSSVDVGFNQSVQAALALADGNHKEAIGLARAALSIMEQEQRIEFSPIAVDVILHGLADLGRHDAAVEFWLQRSHLPNPAVSAKTLLAAAASFEALGRFEEAYEIEIRAYRIRSQHNIGLPTIVTLAHELALSQASKRDTTERLSAEDHTDLWARTNKLSDLIADLRCATSALVNDPARAQRPGEIEALLGPKISELERAVISFDNDAVDASMSPVAV